MRQLHHHSSLGLPLLLLACWGLVGCDIEFDDSAVVHQVQASGMTPVTYMVSNIRPNA